jgi:pantoate--beta-alanine ligase
MKIIKSFKVLRKEINFNESIGFVPTMGSLHKGHLSLIKIAKKKTKKVIVSIFVNPTQFNDKKDFDKYPRNSKKDIFILKKLKIDFLFFPTQKEIYQKGINKKIKIKKIDKVLCAKYRKGHFEGVLAVINRLLSNIHSKYLFLGEKDFQQIYLTKKYLKKKFNTKIISCKTIRNKNQLPLSSRNNLLSSSSFKKSEKISKLLLNFKNRILLNFNNIKSLNDYKNKINELCDKIEYFEIRNKNNLSNKITSKNYKIFIAYRINKIRLIDNV